MPRYSVAANLAPSATAHIQVEGSSGREVIVTWLSSGTNGVSATIRRMALQRTSTTATGTVFTPQQWSTRGGAFHGTAKSTITVDPTFVGVPLIIVDSASPTKRHSRWTPPRPRATPAVVDTEGLAYTHSGSANQTVDSVIFGDVLSDRVGADRLCRRPRQRFGWMSRGVIRETTGGVQTDPFRQFDPGHRWVEHRYWLARSPILRRLPGSLAGGTLSTVKLVGAMGPSGALARQPAKALAGSLTPSGVASRRPATSLAGAATPTGTLTRRTGKALAGTVTSSGTVTRLRTAFLALAGVLTSSGVLTKRPGKVLAGVTTPTGVLARMPGKALDGAIASSGALTTFRLVIKALSGTISSSGTLTRQMSKPLAGVVTSGGGLTKRPGKALAGSVASSGVVAALRAIFLTFTGSIGPSGVLTRRTGKALTGSVAGAAGVLTRQARKALTGAVSPSGAVVTSRLVLKALAGVATPTGTLTRRPGKAVAGVLTSSGSVASRFTFVRSFAGSVVSSGALARKTSKNLVGALTSSGFLARARTFAVALAGTLTPAGVLTKRLGKQAGGALTPSGSVIKLVGLTLSGSMTAGAVLSRARAVGISLTGTLTSAGDLVVLLISGVRAPVDPGVVDLTSAEVEGPELTSDVVELSTVSGVEQFGVVSDAVGFEVVGADIGKGGGPMGAVGIESVTDELLQARILARVDPTGTPPEWSVSTGGRSNPGAWFPGSWAGGWSVRSGRAVALSPPIGVGQVLNVAPGVYDVFVKWTEAGRHPVKWAGELTVR